MKLAQRTSRLEDLFVGWMVASGDYMAPSIERSRAAAATQSSVLLQQESAREELKQLVETAAERIHLHALLPLDPAADARIEKMMARQPKSTTRRPVPRK